jgi:hypothetical protein
MVTASAAAAMLARTSSNAAGVTVFPETSFIATSDLS